MTQVVIVTGSAGSGKTRRLMEQYLVASEQARQQQTPGGTLWLTPTRRVQRTVLQRIVSTANQTFFSPNVLTFDLFAEKILEGSGEPAMPMSPVMKRLMLRRIVAGLVKRGELLYFKSICETTGFLDVVSSFIGELKREEIWPEHFLKACANRTAAFARRDQELGMIYDEYQRQLTTQKWYDNEGRFWLARNALSEGAQAPFERVKFLAVDGFADFTQTQYEILGLLSKWIDHVVVSLPVEHPLQRPDLFAKPQAAISRIREYLPEGSGFQIERLKTSVDATVKTAEQCPRSEWSAGIRVVADRLFTNPRFNEVSETADGLDLIAAVGQTGEWEVIAHRIKQLLAGEVTSPSKKSTSSESAQRVRPQDITIGLRSISDDGPRLRDYLTSAGLPVWCEAEKPFSSSPIIKVVMSLLQCELEDWPFERLMAVLDSTFFQPSWPEWESGRAVRAVGSVLRQFNLGSGRETILRVLARFANSAEASDNRSDASRATVRSALALLNRFSRTLERARRSHSLADWVDVLATIAEEFGWDRKNAAAATHLAEKDTRDLDLLQRILRTAADADLQLAGTAKTLRLNLAEFATELRDLLSHETLAPSPEPVGCIRILSVEQIRNLDIPYLFLVGLTESSFPSNRTEDCLFTESERQDFISRGVPLRHRSSDHADEMLLFYSVVTRARRSLTLSYPDVNANGQKVYPSPYVTALMNLFSKWAKPPRPEGSLEPVPQADRVLTMTDLRLSAMAEAIAGRPQLYRSTLDCEPIARAAWNALAACDAADHRFHQRGFTQYEGLLQLPQNQQALRSRYGPYHQFSATELEAYARCPFQFWLANVLRIGTVEAPEEGTDHAARGTLIHEVVSDLLLEGTIGGDAGVSDRFRELVNQLLDSRFSETDLQRALVNVERTILAEWADAFATQHTEYDAKMGELLKEITARHSEIPFGKLPDARESDRTTYPPVRFGDDQNAVYLRGRIDRIDVGKIEGQPGYVVVDYKSGQRPQVSNAELSSGRSIQLALYLFAAKRLGLVGADATPAQMGYWVLQETGFKPATGGAKVKPLDAEKLSWMEQVLDKLLPQLATEIRSGRFVVENHDENCTGRCPYRTVCRVNQIRPLAESLGKRSPERLEPGDTGNSATS